MLRPVPPPPTLPALLRLPPPPKLLVPLLWLLLRPLLRPLLRLELKEAREPPMRPPLLAACAGTAVPMANTAASPTITAVLPRRLTHVGQPCRRPSMSTAGAGVAASAAGCCCWRRCRSSRARRIAAATSAASEPSAAPAFSWCTLTPAAGAAERHAPGASAAGCCRRAGAPGRRRALGPRLSARAEALAEPEGRDAAVATLGRATQPWSSQKRVRLGGGHAASMMLRANAGSGCKKCRQCSRR